MLPAALTLGIRLTLTPRNDNTITLRSASHTETVQVNVADEWSYDTAYQWCNYPLGVLALMKQEGFDIPACDLYYTSDLPEGAGLSSSAAIEVVTAFALLHYTGNHFDRVWLANFCCEVENNYIGVQCGIMDQYTVALGKKDHALQIDCRNLKHAYVPAGLQDYQWLVMNTNKPRSLVRSEYNIRRQECERALKALQYINSSISTLCDASVHMLPLLPDEVIRRRARHVINEQKRVKDAIESLQKNDINSLGRLLNESHASLRDDYEVTGFELDTLVNAAQSSEGCAGARMTGAGFGGCAIALVHRDACTELIKRVGEEYKRKTGLTATFYQTGIGDGVHAIFA